MLETGKIDHIAIVFKDGKTVKILSDQIDTIIEAANQNPLLKAILKTVGEALKSE